MNPLYQYYWFSWLFGVLKRMKTSLVCKNWKILLSGWSQQVSREISHTSPHSATTLQGRDIKVEWRDFARKDKICQLIRQPLLFVLLAALGISKLSGLSIEGSSIFQCLDTCVLLPYLVSLGVRGGFSVTALTLQIPPTSKRIIIILKYLIWKKFIVFKPHLQVIKKIHYYIWSWKLRKSC